VRTRRLLPLLALAALAAVPASASASERIEVAPGIYLAAASERLRNGFATPELRFCPTTCPRLGGRVFTFAIPAEIG